ncbi:hypothetical protein THAOC_22815 [Thalassiosira oceanica]|uniref:Uncharacterized protein n=1 Tax=Thalassiosira oceanica TaxID=159749 RepID=K0SF02_THAOC|nr:hypothetical protein THAOC_22815 [Thalassiosira oceanica]|eukprot:EJK57172.1 hypothetical protein THAOC_22815 [Thalassiosira oceanica]
MKPAQPGDRPRTRADQRYTQEKQIFFIRDHARRSPGAASLTATPVEQCGIPYERQGDCGLQLLFRREHQWVPGARLHTRVAFTASSGGRWTFGNTSQAHSGREVTSSRRSCAPKPTKKFGQKRTTLRLHERRGVDGDTS